MMWSFAWSGVEIFFVISGFVIPYGLLGSKFRIRNYGDFLKKRLVRIEPAYLASIALILLLAYLSTLSDLYLGEPFDVSRKRLFMHIGYLVDIFGSEWFNPAFWTLAVELQYYLLIGILIAVWNLRNRTVTIVTLISFILLSFIPIDVITFLQYTDIFTLGIIGAFYKKNWIPKSLFLITTLFIALLIYLNHGTTIFLVTLICALIIAFFDNLSKNAVLLFLGNISYSLYLLHIPIGGRIINLAKRFELDEFSKGCVVLLAVMISIAASWVFYLLVEKPSHRWSKKIKFKFNQ